MCENVKGGSSLRRKELAAAVRGALGNPGERPEADPREKSVPIRKENQLRSLPTDSNKKKRLYEPVLIRPFPPPATVTISTHVDYIVTFLRHLYFPRYFLNVYCETECPHSNIGSLF